jgi:hypothetical protein
MVFPPPSGNIAIATDGPVSGLVSLVTQGPAVELFVWGKLVLDLGPEGAVSLSRAPETPGYNAGVADPAELDASASRRIVVRGERSLSGRLTLRRGPNPLAELAFAPGREPVTALLANTMQTTIAGRRGDEWLVVEGVEGPQARRWCKLPKLGVVATWNDVEKLLLTSRLCLVDVSAWTISFVMRGSRKLLPPMVPAQISLALQDLGGEANAESVGLRAVPSPMASPPPLRTQPIELDDETTTGVPPDDDLLDPKTVNRDLAETSEYATRILTPEERARALDSMEKTITGVTAPARKASSSGFRLGPLPREPTSGDAPHPIDEESSVSRAFAALTDEPEESPKKAGG